MPQATYKSRVPVNENQFLPPLRVYYSSAVYIMKYPLHHRYGAKAKDQSPFSNHKRKRSEPQEDAPSLNLSAIPSHQEPDTHVDSIAIIPSVVSVLSKRPCSPHRSVFLNFLTVFVHVYCLQFVTMSCFVRSLVRIYLPFETLAAPVRILVLVLV